MISSVVRVDNKCALTEVRILELGHLKIAHRSYMKLQAACFRSQSPSPNSPCINSILPLGYACVLLPWRSMFYNRGGSSSHRPLRYRITFILGDRRLDLGKFLSNYHT